LSINIHLLAPVISFDLSSLEEEKEENIPSAHESVAHAVLSQTALTISLKPNLLHSDYPPSAAMASYVYFKFKSQKEPQRVTIDGPHTDVWNLKREIIAISRLGDGTDFDLKIYKENSNEGKRKSDRISP
jgi:hypothetical protein